MTILKAIGPPGSLRFFVLGVALGLVIAYAWPKRRRLGHASIVAVLGSYALLSWPPAAHALLRSLPAASATAVEALGPVDVLVVFDGDNRRGRVQAAAQVIATAAPTAIYAVGSPLILNAMPGDMVRRVARHPAANTREQVEWLRQLTQRHAPSGIAVVVSTIQAPRTRALTAMRVPGVRVVASPLDAEVPVDGLGAFWPSLGVLAVSRDALYEHAALVYYRWRGWTTS